MFALAPARTPDHLRETEPMASVAELRDAALRPRLAIRCALTAMVVGLVLTERFAVAIGTFYLGVSLPMMYVLLTVLLLTGHLAVDAVSLLLYSGVVGVAVTSFLLNANIDGGNGTSITSMYLLLALYLPLVFVLSPRPENRAHWRWMMGMLSTVLLIVAIAGIVQFYVQFVFHPTWLFDISELIPTPIRGQGIYNSAIPIGSLFKANGFAMREPSGFSYLMAFGLITELALFKRRKRMACFALALLLSYSGTGLLALAIGVLLPVRAKMLVRLGIGAVVVVGCNLLVGDPLNLAFTFSRVGEFSSQGSSAYSRYVAPWHLVDAGIDVTPWSIWLGHGPGMITKGATAFESHDPTWAKLLYEYGIGGLLLFLAFIAYKLAAFEAPFQFRAVLFASWLVMGGHLLSPENVGFLFVVMAVWGRAVAADPEEEGRPA